VTAGYETGSNLDHCVKAIFFSQDEWHDGSLSKRIDRNPALQDGITQDQTQDQKRSFSCIPMHFEHTKEPIVSERSTRVIASC
jgi:hypothetical protein